MKVYLQKWSGMSASLKIDPFTVEIEKESDCSIPDDIRDWVLTIDGEGSETVQFQGDPNEMKGLIFMMVQAVEKMAKREAEE